MGIPVTGFAVKLMVGRYVRVNPQLSEDIACDGGLVGKVRPKFEWKIQIGNAEAADEMVFEYLDSLFSSIDMVIVWFHELDCTLLRGKELSYGLTGLVVGDT